MTSAQIRQATAALGDIPGFHSIEIARRVTPEQRTEFRNDLRRQGHDVAIRMLRKGGAMVLPESEVTYPIIYLRVTDECTTNRIGVQRPRWTATRMAGKYGRVFLTADNRFFDDYILRTGIVVATGNRSHRDPEGLMMVTVDHLVGEDHLIGETTLATMTDITGASSRFLSQQDINNTQLVVIHSDKRQFTAQQRIGGRLYQFDVTENYGAKLRPIWISWTCFFVCNAMTCVLGLTWLHRGHAELMRRNQQLETEAEQRIVAQRNLQGMLDFREHERELIAHEIHDGFVQNVIGAQMISQTLLKMIRDDQPELRKQTNFVVSVLLDAIREARRTINYLKPRVVDEVGLVAALEIAVAEDAKKHEFTTKLSRPANFPRLPLLAERILYRSIREGVRNARQHSGRSSARVSLTFDSEKIAIEIADDGIGFQPDEVPSDRFGLSGMRCRIEMIQGKLDIQSSESGTMLTIRIPLNVDVPEVPENAHLLVYD